MFRLLFALFVKLPLKLTVASFKLAGGLAKLAFLPFTILGKMTGLDRLFKWAFAGAVVLLGFKAFKDLENRGESATA